MRTYKAISTVCAALAAFFACSPINNAGTATQTGNPTVAGILYQPDGKTPAAGVRVHIRPQKTLADTSGLGLSKKAAVLAASDSVVTDSAGRYAFDTTLDTGTYVVEAASGNNAVLIDSVVVTSKDSTDSLAPDTLKPAGALKGVIKLSEGGDPRKVFVLAFGIDRFARVNADGSFKFAALAEAKYDLRLISSLDNYGVLDTTSISVRSADTTDLDTIELPFTGIPTPRRLTISYDTLRQIVMLTWSKTDTALVKSFNIYRRNVDSNTVAVRANASPVVDTIYKDSTGVQGTTYEYMVAAVNKSATEGTKSISVSVTIIPVISLIDSIGTGTFQGYQIFNFDKKGNLLIADIYSNTGHYFAYNSALVAKSSISNLGLKYPYAIDFDSLGNLFTINQDGVFKVDSVGVKIDTLSRFANNENKDLLFYEDFVWITSGIIAKISTDGKTIDSTNMISADGLTFNNDTLLVGGNGSVIRLFDKTLKNVRNWQLDFHSNEIAWSLTKDEKGNIYIAGYHSNPNIYEILIYDSNRKYKGKISLDYLVKYFKVHDNKLYISANGIIKVYQIR